MARPSPGQMEILVQFLEENRGIAKGFLRTAQGKLDTKRKWDEIAVTFNAMGGANKDGRTWARFWADKKCALKKLCFSHNQSMRRTGEGPADNITGVTPIEQHLIGVESASGNTHLTVNLFPVLQHIVRGRAPGVPLELD